MSRLMHHGLQRAAGTMGTRVAIRAGDRDYTWAELDGLTNSFARHLRARGVGAGDRVAMMLSNRVEFVVAVNAISKLGGAAVLLSPAWKAVEVRHAVSLTQPVHGIADGAGATILASMVPGLTNLDDATLLGAAVGGDRSPLDPPPLEDSAESVMVFSSGTTGLPKAVCHTHASMGHAVRHWVEVLDLGPGDRFQVATPPSHILGLLNLLAAASVGACVRLHPRFDLDEILGRIQSERMTLEMAVAPIALALANHPALEDYDLSSLRYIMWGATPVTESVAQVVAKRAGVRWLPAYGASELPVLACNPVHRPDDCRLDSVGLPPTGVTLAVVDLDTGNFVAPGEVGEVVARSPSTMAGYLPEAATADAFIDGWYRTGDVGWFEPDGWVHLTDRSKEMIKVNGFQVAPAELEAVLLGHPSVVDCAVFGIPDARTGEAPVAAVQLDAGATVADGELEQLVADALASYKRLRHLVIVDGIPRLPSGKALRRTLRDQWLAG